MREIIQPPRPEQLDKDVSLGAVNAAWLRYIGPQLNLDPYKLVLGGALRSIVGDDGNAFAFVGRLSPKDSQSAKEFILERMDWELGLPELPDDIKAQISTAREKLEGFDFTDIKRFRQARKYWTKEVYLYTEQQLATNGKLKAVVEYAEAAGSIWSPYWQQFLYGKRVETELA